MTGGLEYHLTFHGINEPVPGSAWQALFARTWPGYRGWYLGMDGTERPDIATARSALARHMPELFPTYERLVALTGGDETAARMLTLWDAPRFAPGCSQAALTSPFPVLCRNYDYEPALFEGTVYSSRFTGRKVIGTGDCLWGLLDGMNDAGLIVSLTFGGRPGVGSGFAIPLVIRYLLEVYDTTAQACAALRRLPVAQSYNLTIVDADGAVATAFVAPGHPPDITSSPVATNHHGAVPEYPEVARSLHSVIRREALLRLLGEHPDPTGLAAAFLAEPLHSTGYSRAFGTLYTALYQPALGCVDYVWPSHAWRRTFDDPDATTFVTLREAERQRIR
jgi:predicted choloylglycine hydrolase